MGLKIGTNDLSNNSFYIDGVNEYFIADDVYTNNSTDTVGTLSAVVKSVNILPTDVARIAIFSRSTIAVSSMGISQRTTGEIQANFLNSNIIKFSIQTDNPIDLTSWTKIDLVQDGVLPVIYINGVAVPQTAATSTDTTLWLNDVVLDNFRIGQQFRTSGTTYDFNGYISQVSYLNTNISAAQVLDLYNNGRPKDPSILFKDNCKYLLKGEDSTWDALQSQFNIPNRVNSAVSKQSFLLDGVNESISVPYNGFSPYLRGNVQFTHLFSVRHNDGYNTAGHQPIISHYGLGSSDQSINIRFQSTSGRLQMVQVSGSTSLNAYSTETFTSSSEWLHGAVTYDYTETTGNRTNMYVNGNALTVTDDLSDYFNDNGSTRGYEIGRYYTFGYFDGYINGLAIINRPITESEYIKWYNNGYPLNPEHIFGNDCVWSFKPDNTEPWTGTRYDIVNQGITAATINMEQTDLTNIAPGVVRSVNMEQTDLISTGNSTYRLNTQGRLKINN